MSRPLPFPSVAANFRKPLAVDAAVRDVGAEIVERLRRTVAAREHDLHAGLHAARLAHGRMKVAVLVEVDEADLADRLAGARDIDVEDRQRAGEIAAAELVAHVLRDEEAQPQRRADRLLNPGQRSDRALSGVGNRADRLQAAHQIGVGRRIERVGVEKIRAAEHVVQRVLPILQIPLGPGAHPGELPLVQRVPIRLEPFCVPLPAGIARQRRDRRTGGRLHAGEELRDIVRAGALGECRALGRCDNDRACDERGNLLNKRH